MEPGVDREKVGPIYSPINPLPFEIRILINQGRGCGNGGKGKSRDLMIASSKAHGDAMFSCVKSECGDRGFVDATVRGARFKDTIKRDENGLWKVETTLTVDEVKCGGGGGAAGVAG
ncbi:MAG: hypothetical protein QXU40_01740 [Candidatus Pacearchaeota archaeon]